VEAALFQHPAMVEAAVLGLEDPVWGQTVAAAVVTRAPVPDAELERFCREHLAGYKVPRAFFRLDALPRNATGKVDRTALRQKLGYLPPSQTP
jgi:acyl-CoA synthetase (AMP-forming)/AMP-acid ligase II